MSSTVDSSGPLEATAPTNRMLVRLLRPDRADVLAIIAFAVTIGVLSLATPIAVQAIVNSIALGGLIQPLIIVALGLLFALGFAAALAAIQTWVVELIQRRIFVRTVAEISARLPKVHASAFDKGHGPELVNRYFDIFTVQKAVSKLLIDALGILLSIVVGLSVLAFYHPLLLAFDIVLLVVIGIIVFGPLRRGEHTAIKESSAKYAMAAWLEEIARSPYAFKTAGAEQWVFDRSDQLATSWLEARSLHFHTRYAQLVSALALQVLASTALLGIGGFLVIQGSLTLGQLVAAELIVTVVVVGVAKMGKHLEHWYDLKAASIKIGQLLDVPIESEGNLEEPAERPSGPAALELRDLAWRDSRGRALFSGLNLTVAPGASVAVTGPSGSGKTALLELLWRMREPSEGAIRLDGRDYRDLSPAAVRRDIGIVSEVEIVHGTVRENVRLHRPFVTDDHLLDAINTVGLQDTIAELPDGLDTMLHPNARTFSGNELKLLMLARALAGAPRLLVIDSIFDRVADPLRTPLFNAIFDGGKERSLLIVSDMNDVTERCTRTIDLTNGSEGR